MTVVGKRNMIIGIVTVACQTFVAWAGIREGTELVGLATVIGAVGATAVGAVFGRAINKKYAAEQ